MTLPSSESRGQFSPRRSRRSALSLVQTSGSYLLAALVPALVFLPNLNSYFVADDWPVLARNIMAWQKGIGLFTAARFGWYRPLFDLFLSVCWGLFGLNPLGYHLCILFLYVLVAIAVGMVGELLTGRRAIGLLSALVFAIHGAHAEPVLWIASANEVLAGLMVAVGTLAYILFRRSSKRTWLVLAGFSYLLGLSSKETALFMPLALVALEWIVFNPSWPLPNWRSLIPTLPFVLVGVAFALFRLLGGSPYPMSVSPGRVVLNLAYYLGVGVLALPDNYGYLTSLPLWRRAPWLPLLSVALAGTGLVILGWLLLKTRRQNILHGKALLFSLAWSLVSLLPVILTATGRTAFLYTMGVSWALSILFLSIWRQVTQPRLRRWAVIALALLICANFVVSVYRVYWWRDAGNTSRSVLKQVADQLADLPADSSGATVWLVGIPDHMHHAYVFRNAFPEAADLYLPGWTLNAILDYDWQAEAVQHTAAKWIEQVPCSDCAVFWYTDGSVERLR
jgi:hypothetical protein